MGLVLGNRLVNAALTSDNKTLVRRFALRVQ
jgi:hypothetical protein